VREWNRDLPRLDQSTVMVLVDHLILAVSNPRGSGVAARSCGRPARSVKSFESSVANAREQSIVSARSQRRRSTRGTRHAHSGATDSRHPA